MARAKPATRTTAAHSPARRQRQRAATLSPRGLE